MLLVMLLSIHSAVLITTQGPLSCCFQWICLNAAIKARKWTLSKDFVFTYE